jgi:hypothetical protein
MASFGVPSLNTLIKQAPLTRARIDFKKKLKIKK